MAEENKRMRQLIGSAADFATDDIVIGDGEIAIQREGDVIIFKIGNGSDTFTSLPVAFEMLFNRSTVDTDDIVNANDGQVGVGTDPINKFSVYGGDYTSGVYRGAVVTDGQNLGVFTAGALSEGGVISPGVKIRGQAVGDWSATNFGASWTFLVTPENTTSPVTGMTLTDQKNLEVEGEHLRLKTSKTPASASATGSAGEIVWDSDYVYVCTATDTWKRAALATW